MVWNREGLGRVLARGKNAEHFAFNYVNNFPLINASLDQMDGHRTEFHLPSYTEQDLNLIRFSSIVHDVTAISLPISGKFDFVESELNNCLAFVPSAALIELHLGAASFSITKSFLCQKGSKANRLIKEVKPFLKNGRVLIRPQRTLKIQFFDRDDRPYNGNFLGISDDDTVDYWDQEHRVEADVSNWIPNSGFLSGRNQDIYNISVPFFSDLPFRVLDKILEDEEEYVSNFRYALKQSLSELVDLHREPKEIVEDIIGPKLHAMDRKFEKIGNMRAIRRWGSVSSLGLGVAALELTPSWEVLVPAAIGIAGAMGAEIKYTQVEKRNFRDNPFHIIWRLSRATVL